MKTYIYTFLFCLILSSCSFNKSDKLKQLEHQIEIEILKFGYSCKAHNRTLEECIILFETPIGD